MCINTYSIYGGQVKHWNFEVTLYNSFRYICLLHFSREFCALDNIYIFLVVKVLNVKFC